jgi:uncharacterized membrane protein YraQ (UPF0718 family)
MLSIFTELADWLAFTLLGLAPNSKLGGAVHFFIEDTTKIFFLLVVMIYFIALIRASLNIEKVRDYLAGKNKFISYFLGSVFVKLVVAITLLRTLNFNGISLRV